MSPRSLWPSAPDLSGTSPTRTVRTGTGEFLTTRSATLPRGVDVVATVCTHHDEVAVGRGRVVDHLRGRTPLVDDPLDAHLGGERRRDALERGLHRQGGQGGRLHHVQRMAGGAVRAGQPRRVLDGSVTPR